MCWSCAAVDGYCYPYDCGATCSTAPCDSALDFLKVGKSTETGTGLGKAVVPATEDSQRAVKSEVGSCGTHGGGTVPCVNDPSYTCTDCGNNPCVDVDLMCWSCAAVDGYCYPYDCGATCSTAPCDSALDFLKVGKSTETGTGLAKAALPAAKDTQRAVKSKSEVSV